MQSANYWQVKLTSTILVPLALLTGFVMPTVLGLLWNDPVGAYIYGGLVARIASEHENHLRLQITEALISI